MSGMGLRERRRKIQKDAGDEEVAVRESREMSKVEDLRDGDWG